MPKLTANQIEEFTDLSLDENGLLIFKVILKNKSKFPPKSKFLSESHLDSDAKDLLYNQLKLTLIGD